MKLYLILGATAALCFSCEQKHVTVNPPGETKETTIIKEAPNTTEKKTETETTTTPGGTTTQKKETIEKK